MRRTVLCSVVLAALPALGACGDDEPAATAPAPAPPAGADAVVAEVQQVAPALESAVRGGTYPQSVAEAEVSLAEAGLDLAAGHRVGDYVYDPDAVEFVLCLEDADGAWASYDTAPMGVRDSGGSGGCPPQ